MRRDVRRGGSLVVYQLRRTCVVNGAALFLGGRAYQTNGIVQFARIAVRGWPVKGLLEGVGADAPGGWVAQMPAASARLLSAAPTQGTAQICRSAYAARTMEVP